MKINQGMAVLPALSRNFSEGLKETAMEHLGVSAIEDIEEKLLTVKKQGVEEFARKYKNGESKCLRPAVYSPDNFDNYSMDYWGSSENNTADPEHYYKTHMAEIIAELSFYAGRAVTVEEVDKQKYS